MNADKQRSKAVGYLRRALGALDHELSCHSSGGGSVGSPEQVRLVRDELATALGRLDDAAPPLARLRSGRIVADSWPFDSDLSDLVLGAVQSYEEYTKSVAV